MIDTIIEFLILICICIPVVAIGLIVNIIIKRKDKKEQNESLQQNESTVSNIKESSSPQEPSVEQDTLEENFEELSLLEKAKIEVSKLSEKDKRSLLDNYNWPDSHLNHDKDINIKWKETNSLKRISPYSYQYIYNKKTEPYKNKTVGYIVKRYLSDEPSMYECYIYKSVEEAICGIIDFDDVIVKVVGLYNDNDCEVINPIIYQPKEEYDIDELCEMFTEKCFVYNSNMVIREHKYLLNSLEKIKKYHKNNDYLIKLFVDEMMKYGYSKSFSCIISDNPKYIYDFDSGEFFKFIIGLDDENLSKDMKAYLILERCKRR